MVKLGQKIRTWWENLDRTTKNCIGGAAMFLVGSVAGGLIAKQVSDAQYAEDLEEITNFAAAEAIKAYDQGVIDGATTDAYKNLMDIGLPEDRA